MTEIASDQTRAFTQEDYDRLVDSYAEIQAFRRFILERFKNFAFAHLNEMDVDRLVKQSGGFTRFIVHEGSIFESGPNFIIIEQMDNDRGPGSTRRFEMPKAVLFTTTETEEEYKQFRELKSKLFG